MRHQFTVEERQRGFRNAIEKVQIEHGLEFNKAVQWLLRKISPQGNWKAWREKQKQGKRILEGTS